MNRENIFREERNYEHFLKLYGKHVAPVAETFAYCLLRNHFHLLVRTRTKEEIRAETLTVLKTVRVWTPSRKFSDFLNAYAKAMNKAYGRTGSLFQHPFGRVPVTDERQFCRVVAYIHQNPRKHGFVEDFREWKWSSYRALVSAGPTRLNRAAALEWFGGPQRCAELHARPVTGAEWFAPEDED